MSVSFARPFVLDPLQGRKGRREEGEAEPRTLSGRPVGQKVRVIVSSTSRKQRKKRKKKDFVSCFLNLLQVSTKEGREGEEGEGREGEDKVVDDGEGAEKKSNPGGA